MALVRPLHGIADSATSPRWFRATVAAAPFVLFTAVYLPQTRYGLMLDDYAWILHSRVRSLADLLNLFRSADGFYRPIVALTFAVDERLFGTLALGYGLTNMLLAFCCTMAIGSLARAIGLPRGAQWFAAAVWLLNFQGIRTAVLWSSGRTVLLLTAFAVMSAAAVARGRPLRALGWLLLALFSKEEAVLLPAVLWVWILILGSLRSRTPMPATVWLLGSGVAEVIYFLARTATNAMTPATAPDYYRLTFSLARLWRNTQIYADEVATASAIAVTLTIILLGRPRPLVDRFTRYVGLLGATWMAGTIALTILVPSRSDLYACLPSVGPCLIAASVAARSWRQATDARRHLASVAVLVCLALLSPIYHARAVGRADLQRFAATALRDLQVQTRELPDGAVVELWDDPRAALAHAPPNLTDAFGSLMDDAFEVESGRRLAFRIIVPPANGTPPAGGCEGCALRLAVVDGRLRPQ